MATRNGKIANLPNDIREQLNLRLLEGEPGRELTAWLNALPTVQSILDSQFNASPISEVNLTLWRQGGYLQWLTERECFDSARALADGDCDLAITGLSAERLLNVLTVRFGQLLMRWDLPLEEGVSEAVAFSQMAKKARILQGISRALLAIHRIQSQSARTKSGNVGSSPNSAATVNSSAASGNATLAGPVPTITTRASAPTEAPHSAQPTTPDSATKSSANKQGATPRGNLFAQGSKPEIQDPKSEVRQILSRPIIPASGPLTLSQTPFKADLDPTETLTAV